MPFGAGAYMWVTISPRLSSGRTARMGENDWPMWIITGRLKGAAASCARRSASRSLASATFSDNRALTPTTTSRWRAIRFLRQSHVGDVHVVQLAGGRDDAGAGAASGHAAAAPPSNAMNSRRPILRVPDAMQREHEVRSAAPLIRDRSGLGVCNGPRKSVLPDLRIFERRSRVSPRSVSAAHHSALRAPCCAAPGTRDMNSRRLIRSPRRRARAASAAPRGRAPLQSWS
jgi:hypothetical protein